MASIIPSQPKKCVSNKVWGLFELSHFVVHSPHYEEVNNETVVSVHSSKEGAVGAVLAKITGNIHVFEENRSYSDIDPSDYVHVVDEDKWLQSNLKVGYKLVEHNLIDDGNYDGKTIWMTMIENDFSPGFNTSHIMGGIYGSKRLAHASIEMLDVRIIRQLPMYP
jgi:hypothetical protein